MARLLMPAIASDCPTQLRFTLRVFACQPDQTLILTPPWPPLQVVVACQGVAQPVGHLPAHWAKHLAPLMDDGAVEVRVEVQRGSATTEATRGVRASAAAASRLTARMNILLKCEANDVLAMEPQEQPQPHHQNQQQTPQHAQNDSDRPSNGPRASSVYHHQIVGDDANTVGGCESLPAIAEGSQQQHAPLYSTKHEAAHVLPLSHSTQLRSECKKWVEEESSHEWDEDCGSAPPEHCLTSGGSLPAISDSSAPQQLAAVGENAMLRAGTSPAPSQAQPPADVSCAAAAAAARAQLRVQAAVDAIAGVLRGQVSSLDGDLLRANLLLMLEQLSDELALLLDEEERELVAALQVAEAPAQCLFLRLLFRQELTIN